MNTRLRSISRSMMVRLIVPAFMLLLPLLTVGGASGANTALASVQVPFTLHGSTSSPASQPDTFFNGYKTVEGIYSFLDEQVTRYPDLAEKVDIGDSWCKAHEGQCTQPNSYSGYDIFALHITNRAISGSKPVFASTRARLIGTRHVRSR